jgi:hypothetical protein
MKVKATLEATPQEFDIDLPVYRKHDCGGVSYDTMHYARIEQHGETLRKVEVTVANYWRDGERKISLSIDNDYHFDPRSSPDYNLGQGEYALTEAEWNQALASLELVLADVGR